MGSACVDQQVWNVRALLADGAASGEAQRLMRTLYGRDRVQVALRYIACGALGVPSAHMRWLLCSHRLFGCKAAPRRRLSSILDLK